MIELIRDLSMLDGVPGFEGEVRNYILARAEKLCDQVSVDSQGNLFAFKKGNRTPARPIMLTAHMDEVGFLVNSITEDGMLKILASGSIDPRVLIGRKMKVGKSKLPGVISLKAKHLTKPDERKKAPELKSLYIDIGASGREDALKYVSIGDMAVFDSEFALFGNDCIKGKALDDRIACYTLLRLLDCDVRGETHFVFTSQEEVGCRGATVAAFRRSNGRSCRKSSRFGKEQLGVVRYAFDTAVGHLKHAHLVGGAVSVFSATKHTIVAVRISFKV